MARDIRIPQDITRREDLSSTAKLCYGAILHFCWRSDECWPAHGTIAALIGASVSAVKDGCEQLAKAGLIEIERRITGQGQNHSNKYKLVGGRVKINRRGVKNNQGGRVKKVHRNNRSMEDDHSDRESSEPAPPQLYRVK
jgi:hypothetical protein